MGFFYDTSTELTDKTGVEIINSETTQLQQNGPDFIFPIQCTSSGYDTSKKNAHILTPDQSSGLLIVSSTDKGNKCCKSELQENVRGDRLKCEIKFYRQTEGCIYI